ncbi:MULTISPECIES: hypothetical protein [unclassified Pseudofrankia]|uniref:hypothetical protein n=1 Tax=Pseudofrankia sp. BMG5.36 TaxID=1834512 RepID=UPI000A94DBFB|nr:hypothetical protein [Pseudofrankia sp. BMG5.37]
MGTAVLRLRPLHPPGHPHRPDRRRTHHPLVIPARAQVFGDLIEAAYDTHRTTLYTQLRWPPPASPHQEHEHGRKLTAYLWPGSDDTTPTFTPPF